MEYKVDEIFAFGKTELKVVKGDSCDGCVFNGLLCDAPIIYESTGACDDEDRSDNCSVIFVKP